MVGLVYGFWSKSIKSLKFGGFSNLFQLPLLIQHLFYVVGGGGDDADANASLHWPGVKEVFLILSDLQRAANVKERVFLAEV